MLATALAIGAFAHVVCGLSGPTAIVIGNGLALSSTAVVLQVVILTHSIIVYLSYGFFVIVPGLNLKNVTMMNW